MVDQADEDEVILRREMIRQAQQGKSYEALGDVVNLFTDPQRCVPVTVTTGPSGLPTATSPRLTIFDLLLAQAKGEVSVERKLPRKARMTPIPNLQLVMF